MANFNGEIVSMPFPFQDGSRGPIDGNVTVGGFQAHSGDRAGWDAMIRLQRPAHYLLTAFCTGDSLQKFWTDISVTEANAPPHTGSLVNFHVLGVY